jgi:hypothetical protein
MTKTYHISPENIVTGFEDQIPVESWGPYETRLSAELIVCVLEGRDRAIAQYKAEEQSLVRYKGRDIKRFSKGWCIYEGGAFGECLAGPFQSAEIAQQYVDDNNLGWSAQ